MKMINNRKVNKGILRTTLCPLWLIILLLIISCKNTRPASVNATEPEAVIKEEVIPRYDLTFVAAGDNLFHITVINAHKQRDGSYDFSPIYTEVKDIIQNADIAFINQETVMAGTAFGYQGYPTFNTPQSLAGTLVETGFDVINLANNHAMDMGRAGLYNTLDLFDTFEDITVIGARKTGESQRIITKNNITLGFLSYAHDLNGFALPRGEPNLVSVVNRNRMAQEISALRPLCDFLIVSMHWGDEYMLIEPVRSQKDLALFLAEQNVDLIIGHHPHVLQRVESLPRPDGKQTICFYSLGNYVSHQVERDRVLGGMLAATFTKEGDRLSISDFGMIPIVTHFEPGYVNTKVYPFYSYTQEILNRHLLHHRDRNMDFEYFKSVLNRLDTKIFMFNPF